MSKMLCRVCHRNPISARSKMCVPCAAGLASATRTRAQKIAWKKGPDGVQRAWNFITDTVGARKERAKRRWRVEVDEWPDLRAGTVSLGDRINGWTVQVVGWNPGQGLYYVLFGEDGARRIVGAAELEQT